MMIVIHYKCTLIKLPIRGCEINDTNLGWNVIKVRLVKFLSYYMEVHEGRDGAECEV